VSLSYRLSRSITSLDLACTRVNETYCLQSKLPVSYLYLGARQVAGSKDSRAASVNLYARARSAGQSTRGACLAAAAGRARTPRAASQHAKSRRRCRALARTSRTTPHPLAHDLYCGIVKYRFVSLVLPRSIAAATPPYTLQVVSLHCITPLRVACPASVNC
jgi:hypothetical protein